MIRMKYSHRPGVCEKSSTEYAVDHIISSQKESLSGGAMTETENCKKLCADCKTSTTPLWRCGPTGPKSLCNACGIRFRKKLGMNKGSSDKKKEKPSASPASSSTSTTARTTINGTYEKGNDGKISVHDYKKVIEAKTSVRKGKEATLGGDLRMRLMGLGKEVVLLRRPRSPMKRQRSAKKLGEVEQAALLLMALSYGSVYACF